MERKLAAIFSTDVKDYSRLMGDDEEATIQTLKTYREVMTRLIEQHHGRVVDSPGDNLLAEFASAVDAVKSAVAIQQELKTRNAELDAHRRMEFRIGLNVGDVIVDEGRLYGDGVNIAARLEGLADPGGICLSGTIYDQIANKVDFPCVYQGEQAVKNIADPVRVYKVELDTETLTPTVNEEPPVELPLPDKPSIAVLPFTNMSNDPEQEYFSDGITEDLITDLSKISGLFVIARNSTFTYKGQAVDVSDVSRKLGVRYVVEGSVRKLGTRVRITAQLVDARTGGHLWADRYDRELTDLFTLEEEVRQKIVLALKVTLTPEEQARFRRAPTTSLEAYDAYLRGMAALWRFARESTIQARTHFEQAITADTEYAAASAALALTHMFDAVWQWSADRAESVAQAATFAQRAVVLNAELSLPHSILGMVYVWKQQLEQGIAEGRTAIQLDPNDAHAYGFLAETLNFADRAEEAHELAQHALRLNPHDAFLSYVCGNALWWLGRHEEARGALERSRALAPDLPSAYAVLAQVYSELGRYEDARAVWAERLRLVPHTSLSQSVFTPARIERMAANLRKAGLE